MVPLVVAGEVSVFLTTSGLPLAALSWLADDDDKKMYFDLSASFWERNVSGYSSYSIVLSTRCLVADAIWDCSRWWWC